MTNYKEKNIIFTIDILFYCIIYNPQIQMFDGF